MSRNKVRKLPTEQSRRSNEGENKRPSKATATPTSGGGIKEFGKDLKRSYETLNSNMETARKYVTEDVKRRVTGKPTQREERESAAKKVAKLRDTENATTLKTHRKTLKKLKKQPK